MIVVPKKQCSFSYLQTESGPHSISYFVHNYVLHIKAANDRVKPTSSKTTPQTAHLQSALQSYYVPKPLKQRKQNNTMIDRQS
jgi:hypothetical protein